MVLCAGLPDTSSKYADEGTMAHALSEHILRGDAVPEAGTLFRYENHGLLQTGTVTQDMLGHTGVYIDNITQYANGGELMVEQKLNYATYLGLPRDEAWGTSDAVIIKGSEIQVHDLKYGQGEVVSAERNTQMMLYALGALDAFDGLAGDFTHARMVIHQPRVVKAPQEWDCTVEELLAFGAEAKQAVHWAKAAALGAETKTQAEWEAEYLRPSVDACRWCKAKATCPKLRAEVLETVTMQVPATAGDFADLSIPGPAHIAPTDDAWLGASMGKADLIEGWLKAVRAEVERRLLAGGAVPGYKLVQGKQGNRAWSDAAEAEKLLKSFRLKEAEMYDFKIISPTSAEKVLESSPKRWAKAQELITRSDGKPSVAPLKDKRPALEIKPVVEMFADMSVADDLG